MAVPSTIQTASACDVIHQRDISRLCCRAAPHHCHPHDKATTTAAIPTTVRTNIPPMLFWLKSNLVSPVKLRTGSSVPVIAKRRTNAQTKHIPSQPMNTKHVLTSSNHANKTRKRQCTGTRNAIRHMSACTQQAAVLPNTDPASTQRPSPLPSKQHDQAM
jgi:hypothetical protein